MTTTPARQWNDQIARPAPLSHAERRDPDRSVAPVRGRSCFFAHVALRASVPRMPAPAWPPHVAVIPPYGGADATTLDRSPYVVTMLEIVDALAYTAERRTILDGLLNLRTHIRAQGVIAGFQWVDGSFVEAKEVLRGAPPADVDVVTWIASYDNAREAEVLTLAGTRSGVFKARFHVDHYTRRPSMPDTVYWYSLFAHTRERRWKGFVSVDLTADDAEDQAARQLLVARSTP